ncbi:MAG: 6-phosphofructokinase, partial [Deltaproteobacteria bacterium]
MEDNKLYIVMVGLPARGKSTISFRLQETFRRDNIHAKVFNNGNLRRKYRPTKETYSADFYSPDNKAGVEMRKRFAMMNISRAKAYLRRGGDVSILDATNASPQRRRMIEENLYDHPILYIECINNDEEILSLSIDQKVRTPEFAHLDHGRALKEFEKRINYYEMIYVPLYEERNYIKLDSLHNRILSEK